MTNKYETLFGHSVESLNRTKQSFLFARHGEMLSLKPYFENYLSGNPQLSSNDKRIRQIAIFLAVQNSSIGDLVTHWLTQSLSHSLTHSTFTFDTQRATPETCDLWNIRSEIIGDMTWPKKYLPTNRPAHLPTYFSTQEHTLKERKSYKHSETGMSLLMCPWPVNKAG